MSPDPLVHDLVAQLTRRGLTLACAESLTAGTVSAGIADVPGASAVLRGSAVTYATSAKTDVLGVEPALLAERGAVDADVALAMATGAARLFGADIAVATTGVAGPSEQDGQPVGAVFVALVGAPDAAVPAWRECPRARCGCHDGRLVRALHLDGGRARIRQEATRAAWSLVIEHV